MHIGALQLCVTQKILLIQKLQNYKVPFHEVQATNTFLPPVRIFPELGKIWFYKFPGGGENKGRTNKMIAGTFIQYLLCKFRVEALCSCSTGKTMILTVVRNGEDKKKML